MEWSTLELKVMSCSDLKSLIPFQKPSVCAVVSIINGELKKKQQRKSCLQRQKTPTDREGGGNPEWNHVMNFDIRSLVNDCTHLFLGFDLYCEGVIYGNNSIGEVRVPLKDLIGEFSGVVARFLRYQIRTSDRKPNGVLSFSYKLKGTTSNNKCITVTSSPEVKSSSSAEAKIQNCSEKVEYPRIEEADEQSSPAGICYPSLEYVNCPMPGFYSPPPPNYSYYNKGTEAYNYNYKTRSLPPVYYHPGAWYGMESAGYR